MESMGSMEWSLAGAFDVLAAAAPDRDLLVWKSTRRTYAEVAARTRSFAGFLARRAWHRLARRSGSACGSCANCSSSNTLTSQQLVTIIDVHRDGSQLGSRAR